MISQQASSIFPSMFSTALWDLANARPVHSLMLSSHLFLCLPCLLPSFTVPCKILLARPDERQTWPYHCSLRLFTMARKLSCGPTACWILARTSSLITWSLRCAVFCGSTSFPWLVFFFGALLWGSMIHKHTGRWMWQGSASVVSWNWEKYSCHSKLISILSMLMRSTDRALQKTLSLNFTFDDLNTILRLLHQRHLWASDWVKWPIRVYVTGAYFDPARPSR